MKTRWSFVAALLAGLAVSATAATALAAAPPAPTLSMPPLAYEDTHVLLVWDRKATGTAPVKHRIFYKLSTTGTWTQFGGDVTTVPNGAPVANLKLYTDVTGLAPSTVTPPVTNTYNFKVQAFSDTSSTCTLGTNCTESNTVTQATTVTPSAGTSLDTVSTSGVQTNAIQTAINSCPTNGKITLSKFMPDGTTPRVITSGALYLKGNCTYKIDGTIKGSDNVGDYGYPSNRFPFYGTGGSWGSTKYPDNYKSLINTCATSNNGCNLTGNIRIVGSGTIDGTVSATVSDAENSGYHLTNLAVAQRTAKGRDDARADLISLTGVDGIFISGMKFKNPAMHMLWIARSKNITIFNMDSNSWPTASSKGIHNGDGINLSTTYASSLPASSPAATNAWVVRSIFDNGDDCINLNAGSNAPGVYANTPLNDVHVINNYTKHGHGGVTWGSFTAAWIKNVTVIENNFNGTEVALRFKTGTNRGGGADTATALYNYLAGATKQGVNVEASYPDSSGMSSAGVGSFKNITITNLSGSVASGAYAIKIDGNSSPKNSAFNFTNINITGSGGKGVSVYKTICSANPCFKNIDAASGSFVFESASITSSGFDSGCSPTPTAK